MHLLRHNIGSTQRININSLLQTLYNIPEQLHIHDRISIGVGLSRQFNIVGVILDLFNEPFLSGSDSWLVHKKFRPGFECDLDDTYIDRCEELIGFYHIYNDKGLLLGLHKMDERHRLTFEEWGNLFKQIIS